MIYLPNSSSQSIGGGWSFLDNLKLAIPDQITNDYNQATTYLISGATMVQRDEVLQAKTDGKRIILRVDNAVRNSRNRNTGMTRMYDFAQLADVVVYQSEWAKSYLQPFLKADGVVILNSVDENVFNPVGRTNNPNNFLYSRYNRDETKNFEMARYAFSKISQHNKVAKLYLVGNFSDEIREGNFDFYDQEQYEYLGVLDKRSMAKIYKLCEYFIYPYFNDCCSNTLIEALVSGCTIYDAFGMTLTGGAKEIIDQFKEDPSFFNLDRMGGQYRELM